MMFYLKRTVNKIAENYEARIRRLEVEVKNERERAERAIDQLLQSRQFSSVSTVPVPPIKRDDKLIEKLEAHRAQLARIGEDVESNGEIQ